MPKSKKTKLPATAQTSEKPDRLENARIRLAEAAASQLHLDYHNAADPALAALAALVEIMPQRREVPAELDGFSVLTVSFQTDGEGNIDPYATIRETLRRLVSSTVFDSLSEGAKLVVEMHHVLGGRRVDPTLLVEGAFSHMSPKLHAALGEALLALYVYDHADLYRPSKSNKTD